VYIGKKHGPEKFFTINTWNDRQTVPGFYPEMGECNASLYGTSEGALFKNNITKDTVIWYWRRTMCRPIPLYFDKEVTQNNLKAYRFVLHSNVFDRFENSTADCYKGDNLPNGLSDVSRCFFGELFF
jgi:CD36 family